MASQRVAVAAVVIFLLAAIAAAKIRVAAVQLTPVNAFGAVDTLRANAKLVSMMALEAQTSHHSPSDRAIKTRVHSATVGVNDSAPLSLIVFPEYGMLGNFSNGCGGGTAGMAAICVPVPVAGSTIDCANVATDPLAMIACDPAAAAYSNTSISVNLCESCTYGAAGCATSKNRTGRLPGDAANYFNTQVVILGTQVQAVYRKFHPWATECYDTPTLEVVSFTPPKQDAKFGLFTCFDIVWPDPSHDLIAEGIRAFSYSSAIPIVGRMTVDLFSKTYNATMVNSNLQTGQTAVTKDGKPMAKCGAWDGNCIADHVL